MFSARFVAVTMISGIAAWSTCCAPTTQGTPAEARAAAMAAEALIKLGRVHAMFDSLRRNASGSRPRGLKARLFFASAQPSADCLMRVMIHTNVCLLPQPEARSGAVLHFHDRGLEHFDPLGPQQAVQGNEEVGGGGEPDDTRK